ncbi:hypothetical protein D3C86_2156860 [compost metagenome]
MAGEAGEPGEGFGDIDLEIHLAPVGAEQIEGAARGGLEPGHRPAPAMSNSVRTTGDATRAAMPAMTMAIRSRAP